MPEQNNDLNSNQNNSDWQKNLHDLLEENLKISKETNQLIKQLKSWVVWQRIFGVIKILIILIPIILGIIFLPPLLKLLVSSY